MPPPVGLSNASVASSASRRSRRPGEARLACEAAPPTPLSRDSDSKRPVLLLEDDGCLGRGCVLDDIRERLGDDEVGGQRDRVGDAGGTEPSRVTGRGLLRASEETAASSPSSRSSVGWIPRASSRSSAIACSISSCARESAPAAPASDLEASRPSAIDSGHEPLLRAVVEVALDPTTLGVGGGDDPAARRAHLRQLGADLAPRGARSRARGRQSRERSRRARARRAAPDRGRARRSPRRLPSAPSPRDRLCAAARSRDRRRPRNGRRRGGTRARASGRRVPARAARACRLSRCEARRRAQTPADDAGATSRSLPRHRSGGRSRPAAWTCSARTSLRLRRGASRGCRHSSRPKRRQRRGAAPGRVARALAA